MNDRFLPHNLHWQSADYFAEHDPQLRGLKKQVFAYAPPLIHQLPKQTPGIYTLGGGRQIGKTTLMKQWMKHLLERAVPPDSLFFLTGEMIQDHFTLVQLIQQYLSQVTLYKVPPHNSLIYIIIDEVTYIKDWDQGVKYLADAGSLENVVMVLTGSDLTLMQEARMRFPGRRGVADQVDFHLHPLSFFEFINLKLNPSETPPTEVLFQEFENYLQHGGFLTAINNQATHGHILPATYMTYSDWIRGDMIKRGKSEAYLREFFVALLNTYGTQVTWNSLAHHTSIDHPHTIQGYANLLESMDVLFIQSAIMEDKLLAAPKKAKKLVIKDPFIFHAIRSWAFPFDKKNIDVTPALVESCVITHYQRHHPCFYIKAEGEVDLAYVHENKFFPVEIKWTQQLRPKDLKQIQKYPNALILTKSHHSGFLGNTPTDPLPLHLYNLGKEKKYD